MNWSQLGTILWLRWRLTRNQWSRGGPLNVIITIIAAVGVIALAAICGIGGILLGALVMSHKSPISMLAGWDAAIAAFLFFWLLGIVVEIQRSETIDINRLLHLPISQRDIFIINYIASHLTLSIVLFLPGTVGLSLGLALGKSWTMICLLPLVFSFVFMITAWTYCFRGWLVALMVNKRRRRAIIAGVTFTFILIAQLPNLFSNIMFRQKQYRPDNTTQSTQSDPQTAGRSESDKKQAISQAVIAAHNYVPFLWVGNGAMALAQGNVGPAIWGTLGASVLGGLGLRRAYRSTFRFYQGQTTRKNTSRKPKAQKGIATGSNFLETQLPGIPQEAAAMALVVFRSLTRAPEVKMALATNFLLMLFFGGMFLLRNSVSVGDKFKPFIATGVIAVTFLGIAQLLFNQFGFDRNGFRQLVLLPVPRKYILLGKNLAILPIAAGIGFVYLGFVKFAIHLPLVILLAAGFQLMTAFLLLSMAGNLISVFVPYRIASGTMKPAKVPATTSLLIVVSHMLFPVAMVPIFLSPALGLLLSYTGWLSAAMANLFFSIVTLAVIALLYHLSLAGVGNLLQQREMKILQVVTHEVE
jgi:ABC-2 type transport system permease protein